MHVGKIIASSADQCGTMKKSAALSEDQCSESMKNPIYRIIDSNNSYVVKIRAVQRVVGDNLTEVRLLPELVWVRKPDFYTPFCTQFVHPFVSFVHPVCALLTQASMLWCTGVARLHVHWSAAFCSTVKSKVETQ